jgi:tetratricopeptide (TPR) repeat protein
MTLARVAFAIVLAVCASAAVAQDGAPAAPAGHDAPSADPLSPLKEAMAEQDRLVDQGKADAAVTAARERAKDGTPESYYLLGRALGNVAVKRLDTKQDAEALRLLDDAATAFDKAQEAGGLTYAPAHVGRARVARFRFSITARRIEKLGAKERQPFIEEAKHDLDQAIKEYRAALQIAKTWKEAALELAQTLWERQLPGDAEYELHKFLATRPNDGEARMMLGLLKLQRNRFEEAEREFRAVLSADASNPAARKCLAACLMHQEKFTESAEHWEIVRKQNPKDDEAYITLFHVYRQLKKKKEALAVLEEACRDIPGSEAARRARAILDELAKDPSSWEVADRESAEALVEKLDSPDPAVVQQTLEKMRGYKWPALPGKVYRLLLRQDDLGDASIRATHTAQRLAAVRLMLDLGDPQTLTILEILLAHPQEREPESEVRKEVAHAISILPNDGVVPVLFEALGDSDPDVREWAVQGIAARTGKYFRTDLAVRTPADKWPDELAALRKWWASTSASESKRAACTALAAVYGRVEQGSKARVARYALPALDDPSETTWRAGYDLFRALTAETLDWTKTPETAEERQRFAAQAHAWVESHPKGGR